VNIILDPNEENKNDGAVVGQPKFSDKEQEQYDLKGAMDRNDKGTFALLQ
jgi:hypothetical protein